MPPNSDIKSNHCNICKLKLNKCECIKQARVYHFELNLQQQQQQHQPTNNQDSDSDSDNEEDEYDSSNHKVNFVFISIRAVFSILVLIYLFFKIYQIYLRDSRLSYYFSGYAAFEFYCFISYLKQLRTAFISNE